MCSGSATVTVADILELRGNGLSNEELWSLLCQAVQTLQDLFFSDNVVNGNTIPFVSSNSLEICRKGRVVISVSHRIRLEDHLFLAPEYLDPNKQGYQSSDWEKMWVYSLGTTLNLCLRNDTKRDESLCNVLKSMTEASPDRRSSLMTLLNTISEHYKTKLPLKPFSHLVMDMYREVFGTPPQCLLVPGFPTLAEPRLQKNGSITHSTPRGQVVDAVKNGSENTSLAGKIPLTTVSKKTCTIFNEKGRNPVQRAPSRLYRGPFNFDISSQLPKTDCVGPEFVIRGTEKVTIIRIGKVKSISKSLFVILLSGEKVRMDCEPISITCGKIFEILVHALRLEDNYIFGLAALVDGDFVFLPHDYKLHKVSPPGWKEKNKPDGPDFFLYLRVKFFLPNLRGLKNSQTKHLLYLQLRKSLLEQQIKCEPEELLKLGGLALQAEFGDYKEEEHGTHSYFILEHFLPEEVIEDKDFLEKKLEEFHRARYGLDRRQAEELYICQVQRLPEYGSHPHTALWMRKSGAIPLWVTVNPQGIYLYEKKTNVLDRKIHEAFLWKSIQRLSCSGNYFRLVPRSIAGEKVTNYKLQMNNKKVELSPLQALSQEFGIKIENKEIKNVLRNSSKFNSKVRSVSKKFDPGSDSVANNKGWNKENKNSDVVAEKNLPSLVKDKWDIPIQRSVCLPDRNLQPLDAFVLDSSLKSVDENFTYDLHDSIPPPLDDKLRLVSEGEERILKKVRLSKDKYGSFGLEVVKGTNGGVFVKNLLLTKADDDKHLLRKGDQLLSVNGICLLNISYSEALNVLKNSGDQMEVLVSQIQRSESSRKSVESEYLKNIRYKEEEEQEEEQGSLSLEVQK